MFYNHSAVKLEFSNKHLSVKPIQCLEIKQWVKQRSRENRADFELKD